jgi:hypothetical protein
MFPFFMHALSLKAHIRSSLCVSQFAPRAANIKPYHHAGLRKEVGTSTNSKSYIICLCIAYRNNHPIPNNLAQSSILLTTQRVQHALLNVGTSNQPMHAYFSSYTNVHLFSMSTFLDYRPQPRNVPSNENSTYAAMLFRVQPDSLALA